MPPPRRTWGLVTHPQNRCHSEAKSCATEVDMPASISSFDAMYASITMQRKTLKRIRNPMTMKVHMKRWKVTLLAAAAAHEVS